MKQIPLTKGEYAIVDDEDYPLVNQYKWQCHSPNGRKKYARRKESCISGKRKIIKLSSLILNPPSGFIVDHINGDSLDNRRRNLRIATQKQNLYNLPPRGQYRYKGIGRTNKDGKWYARICKDGKKIYIGFYNTPEEAAKAYDEIAKKAYGEFAYLNFH